MTLGGVLFLAVVVSVFVIGSKVKKNTRRLEELETSLSKK